LKPHSTQKYHFNTFPSILTITRFITIIVSILILNSKSQLTKSAVLNKLSSAGIVTSIMNLVAVFFFLAPAPPFPFRVVVFLAAAGFLVPFSFLGALASVLGFFSAGGAAAAGVAAGAGAGAGFFSAALGAAGAGAAAALALAGAAAGFFSAGLAAAGAGAGAFFGAAAAAAGAAAAFLAAAGAGAGAFAPGLASFFYNKTHNALSNSHP